MNAWLAVDLPEKFPELLPPSIRQPRVAFTPQQAQIAFQYQTERLSTVVSLSLEIGLAETPNTLAVGIRRAQAGWVPIPLKDFLDHISAAARRADIMLQWAQHEGAPVALITIPDSRDEQGQPSFVIELIEVTEGALTIAGTSHEVEE